MSKINLESPKQLIRKMTEDLNAALEACEKEEHEQNPIKRLLADDEVRQITCLSYWSLKRYRDKGVLPCVKIGRRILYEQDSVSDFISKFKKG